ncbi:hypothetical protein ES703_118991 [subsurface metagenome]
MEKQTHVTGVGLVVGNIDLSKEDVAVKINNIVEDEGEP